MRRKARRRRKGRWYIWQRSNDDRQPRCDSRRMIWWRPYDRSNLVRLRVRQTAEPVNPIYFGMIG